MQTNRERVYFHQESLNKTSFTDAHFQRNDVTNLPKIDFSSDKTLALMKFKLFGGRCGSFEPGEILVEDGKIVKLEDWEMSIQCPAWIKLQEKL